MLALGFADWTYWEAYNPPQFLGAQKVTFDGFQKLILINEGETEINFRVDVYSAWKEWVKEPNHINAAFEPAIIAIGGDPLPGDRALGTTFFLENGWRMRTWEGSHALTVTGNVFTREGDPLFVPTLAPWTITVNLNTSTLVETILPSISLGEADVEAIGVEVWNTDLDGETAGTRITNNNANNVWDTVIDEGKNQTARDKLKKIATKTQDIALT